MARSRNPDEEINQMDTTLLVFMEAYNKKIPKDFPVATISLLKKFQLAHPKHFKGENNWSIDKHRKRFMDWLSLHKDDESR